MIINEDYFKDLEIEDKDIIEDDNLDVDEPVDFKTYQKYLSTHYSRCIIIATSFLDGLFHDTILWKQTIPDMVNRVNRLLDAYSVEHEVVFRDLSGCRGSHIMYSYKVGRCNVLSKYEDWRFFDVDSLNNAYIIFYCNMPHFTYKESYYFVDRLQNALWRTESSTVFDNLKITTSPCDLMNFAELYSYTYGNKEISLSIQRQHRNDLINNTQPYKKFFKDAIYTFNNTTDDFNTVPYLNTEILNGNDPFIFLKKVKNKNKDS